ncbi:MAG: SDR family NAD(P)-dependent oxidoreductase [Actinomycetota bacterium]
MSTQIQDGRPLEGQVAVVTGGAGEIGAAIVEVLAERGARVLFTDLNESNGTALAERLGAAGLDVLFRQGDMTSENEVTATVASATTKWGRVDIAVGAVGWTQAHAFVDEGSEYWRRIVDLNLMSAVYLTHAALTPMLDAGYGRIVLVSSLAGRIARRERALYSAAKAGVIGFAKAVALEVAKQEITVNCIAPGATDTQQMRDQGEANTAFALDTIPRGKFASTRDQANAVAFLASPDSAHITGQTIAVDGGATMI